MSNNNSPRPWDVVRGGNNQPLASDAVLGGINFVNPSTISSGEVAKTVSLGDNASPSSTGSGTDTKSGTDNDSWSVLGGCLVTILLIGGVIAIFSFLGSFFNSIIVIFGCLILGIISTKISDVENETGLAFFSRLMVTLSASGLVALPILKIGSPSIFMTPISIYVLLSIFGIFFLITLMLKGMWSDIGKFLGLISCSLLIGISLVTMPESESLISALVVPLILFIFSFIFAAFLCPSWEVVAKIFAKNLLLKVLFVIFGIFFIGLLVTFGYMLGGGFEMGV